MANLIKFAVLALAVVAASAGPIELTESDIDQILLDDLIETFALKDQTRIFGNCQPSDRLLYTESVDAKSAILRVKTRDVAYPPDHSSNGGLITCIKLIDELRTGKNGEIKITSGGIGHRFVMLNIKGGRGDPIQYAVQVYGNL